MNGAIKVQGTVNTYRIRVGNYRIVYVIDDSIEIVNVTRVGHRHDVYRWDDTRPTH
jgi:mRNA interferase RelE/StbE